MSRPQWRYIGIATADIISRTFRGSTNRIHVLQLGKVLILWDAKKPKEDA